MNHEAIIKQAQQQANKAEPFILLHNNNTYTGVFNHNEWIYEVYENGFFYININMKSASKAKSFLKQYLTT